ncbi:MULTISPECIES: crotonase/enoyl-CoA hydratase family protein [Actinomycetes]|uniref:crotonase/enoyl-CoA hydratase family protein n=1 Tax=Actinomycetes TaxID=1760 RepID=UPI0004BF6D5E|nr:MULTISPECIES: crotonase/enoyl-CoA hydratase family protein [Actinomycetes]
MTDVEQTVLSSVDGHIATWTLNLPDTRNPISDPEVVARLTDLVDQVNSDADVRVVILTGAGSAFSAGGDLNAMVNRTGMFAGKPHEMIYAYRRGIQRLARSVYGCELPIVAAINGPAVGAGCDLALMCDLRIASTTAFFAESFVKLGIIPGDGGAWLLPRAIGPARAAEMAYTGDRVDAITALAWGLVSEIVEPEALLASAAALARRIAVNPPHSIRFTKRLLRESGRQDFDSFLELSAAMQALSHHSDDHHEALSAFLERRMGVYTGA